MIRLIRYILLFFVILFCLLLSFVEAVVGMVRSNKRGVLGGNPAGAAKAVELWAKALLWLTGRAKGKLAGYVQHNHRSAYRWFRLILLPRR